MKESLKFGPEWLRNTVAPAIETNSSSASAPTRYSLAEFRYGREEMLALFDKNSKLPDVYAKYKKLFVEKIQCPLALTPSTDDDVEYQRTSWSTRPPLGGIASGGRGRGGSADRGRGRGRGFYTSTGYQRSTSLYDEEGRSAGRGERSWIERNGSGETSGSTEWAGAGSGVTTSPRKEYIRPGVESWRRSRTSDEDAPVNDWRSSGFSSRDKWSTRSWREEEPGNAAGGEYPPPPPAISRSYSNPSGGTNGIERGKSTSSTTIPGGKRRPNWEHDDSLPEWATEDPSDYGGSFDATGAFHDSEDDDPRRPKIPKSPPPHHQHHREQRPRSSVSEKIETHVDDKDLEPEPRESSEEGSNTSSSSSVSEEKHLPSPPKQQEETQRQKELVSNDVQNNLEPKEEVLHGGRMHQISESSVDRMQEVADDMVTQLIMEDEIGVLDARANNSPHMMNQETRQVPQQVQQQPQIQQQQQQRLSSEFWFYQDPNQKVQGPFSAQEMAEWYIAGYFDETLLVRRSCDSRFSTLGDLIKICSGEVPFIASHLIPPMVVSPELPIPPPPQQQHPHLLSVLNSVVQQQPTPSETDLHLRYQLKILQKQFIMRQQQIILQKLAVTDTWSLMSPEQQNAMLNHQMSQIQLPDNLQSINAMTNSMSSQQIALLQQEGIGVGGQPLGAAAVANKMQIQPQQQQNHHNVPSSLQQSQQNLAKTFMQQQQQQQLLRHVAPNAGPLGSGSTNSSNPLSQMMQQMSLSHLIAPQNSTNHPSQQQQQQQVLNIPQQSATVTKTSQPSPMIENDPIKSLIMQLSMQKGAGNNPQQQQQLAAGMQSQMQAQQPKHNQIDALLGNMWAGQHLLQQQQTGGVGSVFVPPQAQNRQMMMEDNFENLVGRNNQQESGWKTVAGNNNPLLSMWDMPSSKGGMGPLGGQNYNEKTENETQEENNKLDLQAKIQEAEFIEVKQHQKNIVENATKKSSASAKKEDDKNNRKPQQQKDEKQKQQNNKKLQEDNNRRETDKQRKEKEKRRLQEEEKRKQLEEAAKRKSADERKKLEEMQEQQRKAKLLELQRRETVKIQEQQQQMMQHIQQQQRPPTTMAPWSTTGIPTGPSLAEIEKIERQQRAEQMRIEQALREQQEQQALIQMQQQKESMLKWNASVKPQAVKSLAEIQAEEHAKQTAAEREMAAERQQAVAKQKKHDQQQHDTITGASFWNSALQQGSGGSSAWNTGKIWGANNVGSAAAASQSNNLSGGGFWEEPSKGSVHQKSNAPNANKLLAKSQTMGAITTNKNSAEKQQLQSKATNKSTSNVNVAGSSKRGIRGKEENSIGNEFTHWCNKTLTNMKADVDVPTFVSFLQDIESPFEVKDYIRMYLGETKECIEFSKQFLERRSKLKNQQRAQNAHIDDMCSPAPALTPGCDFQEVKNKTKKIKKNKMTKVDSRFLGFSVTAAPEHWNLEKNLDNSS